MFPLSKYISKDNYFGEKEKPRVAGFFFFYL